MTAYAPIARALNKLPDEERQSLRYKIDIAHFVATEKLSYLKYPQICELEVHDRVNLGSSYLWKVIHSLHCRINRDGLTDKGNIDNELIPIVWCDVNGTDERIHTKMSFFKVCRPQSVFAEGLFTLVGHALQLLGIQAISESECISWLGLALMVLRLTSLEWD